MLITVHLRRSIPSAYFDLSRRPNAAPYAAMGPKTSLTLHDCNHRHLPTALNFLRFTILTLAHPLFNLIHQRSNHRVPLQAQRAATTTTPLRFSTLKPSILGCASMAINTTTNSRPLRALPLFCHKLLWHLVRTSPLLDLLTIDPICLSSPLPLSVAIVLLKPRASRTPVLDPGVPLESVAVLHDQNTSSNNNST